MYVYIYIYEQCVYVYIYTHTYKCMIMEIIPPEVWTEIASGRGRWKNILPQAILLYYSIL